MQVERISRFKKERFLKSLSEDEFRDRVVRPLMLRSNYSDGRDLCGPSEHGKDAIFSIEDGLGLLTIIAIQTKKGNLNLAGTTSKNLIDAMTQIRTALATSIILIASKQKVRPNRIILAASGKINDAARQHILDEIRDPNITFFDSDDLIPRIDLLLPELWLGIEADILPYFNAIETMINGDRINSMEDAHDRALLGGASDETFVTLSLHRNTIKKRKVSGKFVDELDFEELPMSSIVNHKARRILILGEGGSGKSTGLMRLALEMARQSLENDTALHVPIIMRAVEIFRAQPISIVSYADDVSRSLASSHKSCFTDKYLVDGRVLLLIDGFDELAPDGERVIILNLIDEFIGQYPKCQVIIASRPYRFVFDDPILKKFEQFNISPISWKQAEKIVKRITEQKKVPQAQANEFLRRLEKIHGFELNPLLVTVFAATTEHTKQDIPANITELFKKFTELMLGRWDEKKGLKQQYQAPLKDFVLTRLAFNMHTSRKVTISRIEANEIIRDELVQRGHEQDVPSLLDEIFNRSGLFRVVGGNIEFRHHLFQEFFAGRGIAVADTVHQLIYDEWWKRALIFYFGEKADNVSLLSSAAHQTHGLSPMAQLEAATTVGLALQACYLSQVVEKLDLWKWVIKSIETCQDPCILDIDPNAEHPLTSFFHYYLYVRDSVSLSHLRNNVSDLLDWCEIQNQDSSNHSSDKFIFWLITGLIEAGEINAAEKLVQNFRPDDARLIIAIHLGCHLAREVRPLSSGEKASAQRVCNQLDEKVAPYTAQIVKEMGSLLLEMRNGKVEVIENEYP